MGIAAHSSFTARGIRERQLRIAEEVRRVEDRALRRYLSCLRHDARGRRERMIARAERRIELEGMTAPPAYRPTLRRTLIRIARAAGVHPNQILSTDRTARVAFARQAFMYWGRRLTGKSTSAIGHFLGRDHTTVLHGISVYPLKRKEMGRHVREL